MDRAKLKNRLQREEGVRNRPYKDSVGKLSVGVGRNLDDVPFSDDEIQLMLDNDVNRAVGTCKKLFPLFDSFSEERQEALVDMAFNLGETRLRGFHQMIDFVNSGNWSSARMEAINSVWFHQVGDRAVQIVNELGGQDA